jgi:glutamate formiminotransferase / 5-formyltetrahydrofolate cyclo-ligase
MKKIIECVPNIIEGRDQKVIKKLAEVIEQVDGVKLLDIHSDSDHNRSVYTFLGSPEAVLEASFNLAKAAVDIIDIANNDGVHPYLGVIDVIPFIPVKNVQVSECVEIAHKLGEKIVKELAVPANYYGEAALTEEFKNLAELRKKGDELPNHNTAGSISIGVRDFLIAYNINLKTTDVDLAKKIASKIREKNGGIEGVKALGLNLESKNCVQVSMNLVKPSITPPFVVENEVRKLAEELQVEILEVEIVGLLPEDIIAEAEEFN